MTLSEERRPRIRSIGNGKPNVAVVVCVHGDERFGLKIFKELENLKRIRGTLTLIIAHPFAVTKNKRFIETDLNRSFPGSRNGSLEEQIARDIVPLIQKQDLVLDFHATRSDLKRVAILTKTNKRTKTIVAAMGVPTIIRVNTKKFGKGALIDACANGISLEYGRSFLVKHLRAPMDDARTALASLGMLAMRSRRTRKKPETFVVTGVQGVPNGFRRRAGIRELVLIKKGTTIGYAKNAPLIAKDDFYPAFVGRGRYRGTFSLKLKKSKA